ncbi:hypothetical protein RMSM_03329 [Rhodopirellula maiorica SM1]|uniref:Uncharacterized protein n=1 Tax=Rhodopirellula maiorica SM1 TaxID=1265738 RepID=M5S0R0_9BACT|nr:hypothetical protein RMSM_03329 [Rhodopirellula maiorica SM1]
MSKRRKRFAPECTNRSTEAIRCVIAQWFWVCLTLEGLQALTD